MVIAYILNSNSWFSQEVFRDLDIKRAFSGIRNIGFNQILDGFHRNTPKKEKSIDIGFLNRGFSQEFGSISYWTVFGFGLSVFRDTWIFISINFRYKAMLRCQSVQWRFCPFLRLW